MARKSVKKSALKSQTSSRTPSKDKAIISKTKAPSVAAVKSKTTHLKAPKPRATAKGAATHNMRTTSAAKVTGGGRRIGLPSCGRFAASILRGLRSVSERAC